MVDSDIKKKETIHFKDMINGPKCTEMVKETEEDTENAKEVAAIQSDTIDNMIYYNYRRDQLETLNKRRISYWLEIFGQITKRIQIPAIFGLIDREEMHKKKINMIQKQI